MCFLTRRLPRRSGRSPALHSRPCPAPYAHPGPSLTPRLCPLGFPTFFPESPRTCLPRASASPSPVLDPRDFLPGPPWAPRPFSVLPGLQVSPPAFLGPSLDPQAFPQPLLPPAGTPALLAAPALLCIVFTHMPICGFRSAPAPPPQRLYLAPALPAFLDPLTGSSSS